MHVIRYNKVTMNEGVDITKKIVYVLHNYYSTMNIGIIISKRYGYEQRS